MTDEYGARLTEAEWQEIRVECAPPTDYGILRGLIERIVHERVAQAWDEGFADAVKWNGAPMCRNPYRVFSPGGESDG